MQKGLSLEVWQPKIRNIETFYSPSGVPYFIVTEKMGPPYGDDPRDQEWIKHGFRYKKYK